MTEKEIKMVLEGVADTNRDVGAVLSVVAAHLEEWEGKAVGPGPVGEERAYAAGAAYGLRCVLEAIEGLRRK